MRRVLISAAACLAVAGCAAPQQPAVSFYGDGDTVRATTHVECSVAKGGCETNDDAIVELKIRPGLPVQISVPEYVAAKPWGVTFTYVDRDGQRVDGSSRIFLPYEGRRAYTLDLPQNARELKLVTVQTLSLVTRDQLVPTQFWTLRVV